MLRVEKLDVAYGHLQILRQVDMHIKNGEIVAILGANGAGKTTLLKSVMGLLPPKAGKVYYRGKDVTGTPTFELARQGISFVPEERNIFQAMSVEENLLLGAYYNKDKAKIAQNLKKVYDMFPRLAERRKQLSGTMSGGERQMLAIGRGLMNEPHLIILDEPSMGLSPTNVLVVFETIKTLTSQEVTIAIVEQNVHATLNVASRAYVMEHGAVVMEGTSEELSGNDYVKRMYLGQSIETENETEA
ncbi:MAG: ABC transporter ATP-binding protein [Deltaproteobacteria bacterium]|jgi:branched-chain amino acid transport system ATP-binding protein|nr:ABC transporter ATP-binding protein [Deltaproteobacteria bacterium]